VASTDLTTFTEPGSQTAAADPIADLGAKYLTFTLADEEYGVAILKVREIMGLIEITHVPQMPGYVKGVINLRGKVIPVIDLRLRFSLDEAAYTDETCIIVVDVGALVGIIVDTVQEVADIPGRDIAPPPSFGASVDTAFLTGMGKVDEKVKILLDIDRILSGEEAARISKAAAEL